MVGTYRLILAIMVLGSHTSVLGDDYPDLGLIAVVTFFFISGFLMPASFEANYRFQTFGAQLKMFYWARFLRIYPMYWIALFIAIVIVPAVTGVSLWYDGGFAHAGTQNIVLLGLNQATFWSSETRIVNVAWTLDIELQFYLLVPFFILLRRRASHVLYGVLAAISLYSVYRLANPTGVTGVDRFFGSYGVYFCAGIACFRWRDALRRSAPLLTFLVTAVSGVAFVVTWHQYGSNDSAWPLSVIFVVFAALLLVASAPAGRWDRYLGDLSYPTFLFHGFVVHSGIPDVVTHGLPFQKQLSFLAAAVLSLIIAAALERLVGRAIDRARDRAKSADACMRAVST